VKAVQDVQRLRALLGDDVQMTSSRFEREWRGSSYARKVAGHLHLLVSGRLYLVIIPRPFTGS
jgi:hypothetical protein